MHVHHNGDVQPPRVCTNKQHTHNLSPSSCSVATANCITSPNASGKGLVHMQALWAPTPQARSRLRGAVIGTGARRTTARAFHPHLRAWQGPADSVGQIPTPCLTNTQGHATMYEGHAAPSSKHLGLGNIRTASHRRSNRKERIRGRGLLLHGQVPSTTVREPMPHS